MVSLANDLYFTNIRVVPTAVNAMVCKQWYINIQDILKKQKQAFYELQIYNLIANKYSNYPPYGYHTRRRLNFDGSSYGSSSSYGSGNKKDNIYEDNIFNIAYDNMIKNIFEYLKTDTRVFQSIKESLIVYYTKYVAIHNRCCRMELFDILNSEYIDEDIASEYKGILLKYYNHDII
jgi:hypothetical protein